MNNNHSVSITVYFKYTLFSLADCPCTYKVSADHDIATVRVRSSSPSFISTPSFLIQTPSSDFFWCARGDDATEVNTTLYIDFKQEVIVERFAVNGYSDSFVSQFQLSYQKMENESFSQYEQVKLSDSVSFSL